MQHNSLYNNWIELKTTPIGNIGQENRSLTIEDLLDWVENVNSWQSILFKIKIALQGKGWLNSAAVGMILQQLPLNELDKIHALIRQVQHQPAFFAIENEDPLPILNRIELLDLLVKEERQRRMRMADVLQTLKHENRAIYDLIHHEHDHLLQVESALFVYRTLLKEAKLPREPAYLAAKLAGALENLGSVMRKFHAGLFEAASLADRAAEVANIFQSGMYREYAHALAEVTKLYFQFVRHEETLTGAVALLGGSFLTEALDPLTYIKIVPEHRAWLERLAEDHASMHEMEPSIKAVHDIQARWFNH